MRKSILTIIASFILFVASAVYLAGCGQNKKEENTHEHMEQSSAEVKVYSCPMHSQITGKETDKCSKCGMALTETKASEAEDHSNHK